MNDDPLDTFDDEQPHVTADGRPHQTHGEGEAFVKIVLTEEQLAAACDLLPSEGAPAEGGGEDRLAAPASILEYADDYQSLAALVPAQAVTAPAKAVMAPSRRAVQRGSPSVIGPRIAMVSATLFVTLVIVLLGGRTLVQEFAATRPAAGDVDAARSSSSTPTRPAVAAGTPTPTAAGPSTPTPVHAAARTPTPTVTAPGTPTPTVATPNTPTPTVTAPSTPTPSQLARRTPTPTAPVARTLTPARPAVRTPTPPQLARRTPTPTVPAARTPTPPQLARRTPTQPTPGVRTPTPTVAAARTPTPTVPAARTPTPTATTGRTPTPPAPRAATTALAASTPTPPVADVSNPTPIADAGTPAPVTPPAAAPAVSPVVAPPIVPSAPALAPDTRAVLLILYRYQEAFSALDSNAAHAVWPSVDVKALDRAFDQLEQQTFNLQGCNVTVSGTRADASCTGSATYARKVGNRAVHEEPRQWHFTLQQRAGQWLIDRVDAR